MPVQTTTEVRSTAAATQTVTITTTGIRVTAVVAGIPIMAHTMAAGRTTVHAVATGRTTVPQAQAGQPADSVPAEAVPARMQTQ